MKDSIMQTLLDALGKRPADLAKEVGINPTTLHNYVKGRKIRADNAAKIVAQYPNVSLGWLITGQGSMFVSPPTLPEQDQPKKKGRSAGDRAFDAIENNPDLEKILDAMQRENERLKGENERQKGIIEYLEKKLEDRGGAPWQEPKGPISAGLEH
jgi:hypothetical protein